MKTQLSIRIIKQGRTSKDCDPPFSVLKGKVTIVYLADAYYLMAKDPCSEVELLATGERIRLM